MAKIKITELRPMKHPRRQPQLIPLLEIADLEPGEAVRFPASMRTTVRTYLNAAQRCGFALGCSSGTEPGGIIYVRRDR